MLTALALATTLCAAQNHAPTGIPPIDEAIAVFQRVWTLVSPPSRADGEPAPREEELAGPATVVVNGEEVVKALPDPELDEPLDGLREGPGDDEEETPAKLAVAPPAPRAPLAPPAPVTTKKAKKQRHFRTVY